MVGGASLCPFTTLTLVIANKGKYKTSIFNLRKNYFIFCWRRRKRRRAERVKHTRNHADGIGFDVRVLSVIS